MRWQCQLQSRRNLQLAAGVDRTLWRKRSMGRCFRQNHSNLTKVKPSSIKPN
jgi:hypothetical protein